MSRILDSMKLRGLFESSATMSTPGLSEKASLAQPADERAVPAHLRCNSCSKTVFNAFQTPHGCRICQSCVNTKLYPTEKRLCPGTTEACKDEDKEIHICQASCMPDITTRREISKLTVYCPNRDGGCKEQMKWREVDTHLEKCEYEKVSCEQCRDSVLKKMLRSHLSDECRQRRVPCSLCQQSVVHSEMEKNHRNLDSTTCCPRYTDYCPFCKDRSRKMNNREFYDHLRECRYNLSQFSHQFLKFRFILDKRIRQHKRAIGEIVTIIWEQKSVRNWRRKAVERSVTSIFSQPFSFGRHTFKVRLFLNGNESGEGSHVSVYLVLMQQELNDTRELPLKAIVSFKMVNRRNRDEDVVKTVRFDPGEQRPSSREDLSVRCGDDKFMSINQFENSGRFVKNDSFYLEVEVAVDG